MSIPWGPALDAEVAYRHQQVRNDFHRWSRRREPALHVSAQQAETRATAQHIPAQPLPAQRVPVPLIPIRPRPVDKERTSAHAA